MSKIKMKTVSFFDWKEQNMSKEIKKEIKSENAKDFICEHCGNPKKTEQGLCSHCGKFSTTKHLPQYIEREAEYFNSLSKEQRLKIWEEAQKIHDFLYSEINKNPLLLPTLLKAKAQIKAEGLSDYLILGDLITKMEKELSLTKIQAITNLKAFTDAIHNSLNKLF